MPQYTANHLRDRLLAARHRQGFSQKTVARMMGMKNYETVYQLESGYGGKMLDRAAAWAGALGFVLTPVPPDLVALVEKMEPLESSQIRTLSILVDSMLI